ncbi:serine hydrolase [Flavobacterium degerlachei]|jgi:CubicO group peptidase (beta-lactamase class C family)|uniref:CubicO group peptidase, beta-lactamase class C family n=1 Tax=Flavobacterium degerlachei TaxID=229203 RepID=A0A1H2X7R3_9FLAO|nr:serine hydrolase [Flavobacterium degerlachei]SDW88831.1 CubicO group peptidase, beta-lactamase class C family [Flavobacterium degerlachei]
MKNNLFVAITLISTTLSLAQISPTQVDELVNRTIKTFNVPGIAVAIVKDGKVVLAEGYGVKSIDTKERVDANTLFGIASNSKAFTSAALAILVDEGKIKWDDKVIKYLPNFRMYNDYVTQEFTIRDLLSHRSGLGLGAGDLMIWPDGSNFTAQDIIQNLQYLKPVSAFRTKYDYDNLLYIVAGEVVHVVSGKSWADFVEDRIMKPLEMNNSAASFVRLKDSTNIIAPHVPIDGKLKVITRYKNQLFDAAAGIYSSVNDLSKWAIMQMNNGKYGADNKQLFSEKEHAEMWTPQTIIPISTVAPYNSHFKAYGLGWFLSDVKGYKEVTHTGGLEGIVTQTTYFPELQLGIIVLTNQQSGAAFRAITNTIKDSYLDIKSEDYVALYSSRIKANEDSADKVTDEVWATVAKNKAAKIKTDYKTITGTYTDSWFGDVIITEKKGKLYFESKRSSQLKGEVFFYKEGNYVVKWDNAYLHADAHLFFQYDKAGKATALKMKPISDLTDFSYDFQDLDFTKAVTN